MEFIITILVMDIFIVLIIYRRLRHHIQYVSGQAKARLNYIRILIDTVYTYSHQPELLQKHLQKENNIDQKNAAGLSCDRHPAPPSFLRQNESEQQRPIAIHAS